MKNAFSYLYPVSVETTKGDLSPRLEVSLYRGRYQLNTEQVNYSYGGLHTIFDQLFTELAIEKYAIHKVLILGMGAGSVVSLLSHEHPVHCSITAVEGDDVVITLAKKYFKIDDFQNIRIVWDDALHFVENCNETFDLIISDLFVDEEVPSKFGTPHYLKQLKKLSSEKSCVIYNKMTEKSKHKTEFGQLANIFHDEFPDSKVYTLYAGHSQNSLLCANTLEKKSS